VKVKRLDTIIELSTESEGESPDLTLIKQSTCVQVESQEKTMVNLESGTPSTITKGGKKKPHWICHYGSFDH